jgi:hypothetical protein
MSAIAVFYDVDQDRDEKDRDKRIYDPKHDLAFLKTASGRE